MRFERLKERMERGGKNRVAGDVEELVGEELGGEELGGEELGGEELGEMIEGMRRVVEEVEGEARELVCPARMVSARGDAPTSEYLPRGIAQTSMQPRRIGTTPRRRHGARSEALISSSAPSA